MGVKFQVNKDSLDRVIVPEGMYELEVVKFDPKNSKNGDSHNINGQYLITGPQESLPDDPKGGKKKIMVFDSLNDSFGVGIQDFVHACGFELDAEGNIPGEFEGEIGKKMTYVGPLIGRRFKAELVISDYNGQPSNKIRSYVCAVPDCASKNPKIKHSSNLVK